MYAHAGSQIDSIQKFSNGSRLLSLDVENEHALLVYAIFSTVVLVSTITSFTQVNKVFVVSFEIIFLQLLLSFLICCCLWQGTTLVVELFRQAGRCLRSTPLLLIQPMWTFVALMVLFIYWSVVVLLLATAGTVHCFYFKINIMCSTVGTLWI